LFLLVCLSTSVFGEYKIQDYYDPTQIPSSESPDGNAYRSSFNFTCDPWKNYTYINDAYYDTYPQYNSTFCPQELRSPSGCGDFKGDTRGVNCSGGLWTIKYCSMKIVLSSPQPFWKQAHLCAQDQMPEYQSQRPSLAPFGDLKYPPFGTNRHRAYWAVYGEYEYCPPERWLHNSEHGAAIFLYRPCIDPVELCKIKQFILSRPGDNTGSTKDPSNTGPFRWILTPYKNLNTKFALVTFPQTLFTDCFDWDDWNEFLDKNYRQAFEDLSLPGRYEYLWIGNSTCPGYGAIPSYNSAESVLTLGGWPVGYVAGIIAGFVALVLLVIILVIVLRPKTKSGGADDNYGLLDK